MKNKKITYKFSLIIALIFIYCNVSCNKSGNEIIKLIDERDSLRTLTDSTQHQLSLINTMISTINGTLDSIAIQEGMLFTSNSPETPIDRIGAIRNLDRFQQILYKQKERIHKLESELSKNKNNNNLENLIEHLKKQLDLKDRQIAQLRRELSNKNVNISQLRRKVESQRTQIARQNQAIIELDKKSQVQNTALANQDAILNHCYVLIGTKKDLKRKGIIKRKKLQSDAFNKTKFAKVDIRKYREISFQAKRPRILTNMPTSSYILTTNGNKQYTLKITDPANFWSISNFLVIQTD